jgi:hypothetical protein
MRFLFEVRALHDLNFLLFLVIEVLNRLFKLRLTPSLSCLRPVSQYALRLRDPSLALAPLVVLITASYKLVLLLIPPLDDLFPLVDYVHQLFVVFGVHSLAAVDTHNHMVLFPQKLVCLLRDRDILLDPTSC